MESCYDSDMWRIGDHRWGLKAEGAVRWRNADSRQDRCDRRLQGVEGDTRQVGDPLGKPLRSELPPELVLGGAHPGLLPAARPGGPEQAAPRERLRVRAELRLYLRAVRPLRTDTGGVPPSSRRRVGARVGSGGTPRGALVLQSREGPSHSLRPAARGRGNVHQGRSGGQVLPGRRALGGRGGGGSGGAAQVHGGGGELVVTIKAGGEEKPEREEVVEPLEEPTPERHKERREEKVREEEPEKVPA